MKRILLSLLTISAIGCSPIKVGVKGGLNFANVSNQAGINAKSHTGYMVGGYISVKPKFIGFRSEIILSRQGYNYKTNTNTGHVNLNYLLLPQLLTINFTKKVQLHAGTQLGFLMNAAVDSTGNSSGNLLSYFKRFTYGVVGGVELFPFAAGNKKNNQILDKVKTSNVSKPTFLSGLFIGARLNVSLNNMNEGSNSGSPNFIPKVDLKNNVVQVYMGWRF